MDRFARMSRLPTLGWMAAFLLVGCGSGQQLCDAHCPDVSGSFSLLETQPMGECRFASYVPPPTLTLTQSDGGRHVATELIDPVNQLFVSFEGDVLVPDGSGDRGRFQIQTTLLRQATRNDPRLLTLDVFLSGTVSRTDGGATLSSTLIEVQREPVDGAGCTITIPLPGRTGRP